MKLRISTRGTLAKAVEWKNLLAMSITVFMLSLAACSDPNLPIPSDAESTPTRLLLIKPDKGTLTYNGVEPEWKAKSTLLELEPALSDWLQNVEMAALIEDPALLQATLSWIPPVDAAFSYFDLWQIRSVAQSGVYTPVNSINQSPQNPLDVWIEDMTFVVSVRFTVIVN